jgi:hypothetical protein
MTARLVSEIGYVNGMLWIEPDTRQPYPTAYHAYRRAREAQERAPARHRHLGLEVDRYAWRQWQGRATPDVDVLLKFRDGTSPRIRRMVAEILRGIRRGQAAGEAIRHVSRRFGLRQTRARAFIGDCLRFEVRPCDEAPQHMLEAPCASMSCRGLPR